MSIEPGTNGVILPADRRHDADYDESGKSPQQIERDIAETRSELGELLDDIERKLAPRQLLERGMDMLKDTMSGDGRGAAQTLRQHPVPLALIGIGVGWMLLSQGTRGRISERANDLVKQARDKVRRAESPTWPEGDPPEPSAGYAYARQKSGRAMGEAQPRFSRVGDAARQGMDRAGDYVGAASDRLNDARTRMAVLVEDHPLALGALGVLAGALVAVLLPRSHAEERLVGSAGAADAVRDVAHGSAAQQSGYDMAARRPAGPADKF